MKKLIVLLLAAAMLLSLAACAGKQTDKNDTTEAPSTEAPSTEAPSTEAPSTEAPTDEPSDELLGYANEDMGVRFDVPTDWFVADEATLAQLNGATKELFTDEDIAAQLESSGTAMIFYAQTEDGMQTLNITAENLSLLYTLSLDEEGYIEAALPTLESTLAASGFEDIQIEKSTTTFLGSEHPCISVTVSIQGIPLYETLVPVKSGSVVYSITAASFQTDNTPDMLARFTALD